MTAAVISTFKEDVMPSYQQTAKNRDPRQIADPEDVEQLLADADTQSENDNDGEGPQDMPEPPIEL